MRSDTAPSLFEGMSGIDATLVERVRTLWQVGDWEQLVECTSGLLEGHPLRGQISVLVATAEFQRGQGDQAVRLIEQAQAWGCARELLLRGLVASALNSLGRLHALRGRHAEALERFSEALATGFPGSEHPRNALARRDSQYHQIDIDPASATFAVSPPNLIEGHRGSALGQLALGEAPGAEFTALDDLLASGLARRAPADAQAADALPGVASRCLDRALKRPAGVDLTLSSVCTPRGGLCLLHVRGDYIPQKMLREASFYEPEFLQLLESFHEPGGLIVDVGANLGNHTLYFAKVMGAEVVAFEPEPHNVVCLELNLQLNGVDDRVCTHRIALGKERGTAELTMAIDGNFGSFSTAPASNPNQRPGGDKHSIGVQVHRLDDVLRARAEPRRVSVLKIDVEGMELDVLEGARRTLSGDMPVVACECFNFTEFSRVEALLASFHYVPVAMTNFTPTFIFTCAKNAFHTARLAQYLRDRALLAAGKQPGFASRRDKQ